MTGFRRVGRRMKAPSIFSSFFPYSRVKIGGYKPIGHQKSLGRGKKPGQCTAIFPSKKAHSGQLIASCNAPYYSGNVCGCERAPDHGFDLKNKNVQVFEQTFRINTAVSTAREGVSATHEVLATGSNRPSKVCLEALQVWRLSQSDQGGSARGQRSDRRQRPYYN